MKSLEEGARLHLLFQRREGQEEGGGVLKEGLTQFQNYSWRLLAELRIGVEPGPAPPLPALGGARATAPAPPPAADPCRRQVSPSPIAWATESRHKTLCIG